MKEATGELNMTIVTLVAISAIAALLWFVVWPMIQRMIVDTTCKTYGEDYKAVKLTGASNQADVGAGEGKMNQYQCCRDGASSDCINPND